MVRFFFTDLDNTALRQCVKVIIFEGENKNKDFIFTSGNITITLI